MKIAVPITKSNQRDEYFGHCESYNVDSTIDNGKT